MKKYVVAYDIFPGYTMNSSFTAKNRFTAGIKGFIIARGKKRIIEQKEIY